MRQTVIWDQKQSCIVFEWLPRAMITYSIWNVIKCLKIFLQAIGFRIPHEKTIALTVREEEKQAKGSNKARLSGSGAENKVIINWMLLRLWF